MGRLIRSFTLDHDVSRRIDAARPRGERSRFVNQLLRQALQDEAAAITMNASIVFAFAFMLGLGTLA